MELLRGNLFALTVRCNFNSNRKVDLLVESIFPGKIPDAKLGSFFYPSDSRAPPSIIPTSQAAMALPLARDMMDLYIFMLVVAEAQGDTDLRDELADHVTVLITLIMKNEDYH